MDFLIDVLTGDMDLDSSGQITLTSTEEIATLQRLRIKFQFLQKEWFLDTRQGVPWYQRILIKGSSERVNRSIFRKIIEGDPGVARLITLRYSLNVGTRRLTLDFAAKLKSGQILRSSDFGPFVIEV